VKTKEIKSLFTRLKKDAVFKNIIRKVTLNRTLEENEKQYALELAIILYEWYVSEENKYFFEFSYFLILSYSINSGDYKPLNDFCLSSGFYPVSKLINESNLLDSNIFDIFYNVGINRYKNKDRIETNEQFCNIKRLLESNDKYRSFVAPTSYGKSEFILDDIERQNSSKIGIIVPKKALIWETFRRVREVAKRRSYTVMMHDAEFITSSKRFIAIFTQERALRLLQENDVYFDILYIDEAHNLFDSDQRNILLSRLIRLNAKLNNQQKVIYLSPLINDSKNLLFDNSVQIKEQKIEFNVKEPKILHFKANSEEWIYNRFTDDIIFSQHCNCTWIEYIKKKTSAKSLLFAYRPKTVQDIALRFSENFNQISSPEIDEIIDVLGKYVDKDYYIADLIKKGVMYIHGKVPDSIRDYLLSKYKTCDSLKYLVSNTSILEGVNYPIDSLFILNSYSLDKNNLVNLIGRVNRLNDIFLKSKDITKLLCPIYFVESSRFEGDTSFINKIKLLRSTETIDDISNPVLPNTRAKNEKIVDRENTYIKDFHDDNIRITLIKNGVDSYYNNFQSALNQINSNIRFYRETDLLSIVDNSSIFTLIHKIFMHGFEYNDFQKQEVGRLTNAEACNFYNNYISTAFFADMKTKIKYFIKYFSYFELKRMPFYIGNEFGEIAKTTSMYQKTNRMTYVDIASKSHKEKVNLAIIKATIEDNLIRHTLANFVKTFYDLHIISEETYNNFLYNTTSELKINLLKSGLSRQVINFIEDNDLSGDIKFENYGFQISDKFRQNILNQDDFIKFELSKILDW